MADSKSFDVLIVGAGISGITAAYRLQEQTPERTYTILEARDSMGGTWDLFKYPGIRSDSDMFTFGFAFHPWVQENAIAEGADLKKYIQDTAAEFGIDKKIRYRHRMLSANWSTDQQHWSVSVDNQGITERYHAKFVIFCTGYYDYNSPLKAEIPGIDRFQGQVIHPQFWPEDLDYKDKNVVIVGSGATAVTLLPSMAKAGASHVTMLQRSPTYILSRNQVSGLAKWARRLLPATWALQFIRITSVVLPYLFFKFCRMFPNAAREQLEKRTRTELPKDYPIAPNFKPSYNPWDQRLCVCPDGDFYECLRKGQSSVVTASIKEVTEKSIHLNDSDKVLHPDIIVTATGLNLMLAGGAKITLDNEPLDVSKKHLWKSMMMEDVPNAVFVFGYANASWTLGADITAQFVTRLLKKMKAENITQAVPHVDEKAGLNNEPIFHLSSTYITKAKSPFPNAGDRAPWLRRTYYLSDLWDAKYGTMSKEMSYTRVST